MLNIDALGEAVAAIAIAVTAGALGGLVSELLLERGKTKRTGVLIWPRRRESRLELGSLAAILIGGVGGIAAAALLLPVNEVVVKGVTERQVDWIRVLGVGLVAGAAGQAFWAAITKGLTAADYTARMEAVLAELKGEQGKAGDDDIGGAAEARLSGAINAVEDALRRAP